MHATSSGVRRAAKVDLQVRGVLASLRDKLRQRAKRKGVSMSEYMIQVLRDDLERPTMDEWLEEARRIPKVPGISGAEIIREIRRDAEEGIGD